MEVLVSPEFRDLALALFPALALSAAYRSLFCRLMFPTMLDKETGGVCVSRFALASDEGKLKKAKSRHYCGKDLLEAFKSEVFKFGGFDWEGYRYSERKCRVAHVDWPECLVSAAERERTRTEREGLVYFVSGKTYHTKHRTRVLKEARQEAKALESGCQCPEAADMLAYLNSRPSNGFTDMLGHIDEARRVAVGIEHSGKRNAALNALKSIESQPVPVYAPSPADRTVRLFGLDGGLTSISRKVRAVLCQDWHHADLKNAQLAIIATLWGVSEVTEILESVDSIWPELANHLGVDRDDDRFEEVKAGIKELLYSTIFGMTEGNLYRKAIAELSGLVEKPKRIFEHRLFKVLLEARTEHAAKLQEAGYATTCFGKRIKTKTNADVRSAMAQQAQAVELSLIYPVYELVKENTREFQVMLHLHDGVYIRFSRRPELWQQRISQVVKAKADELGIHTELEWELPKAAESDDEPSVQHVPVEKVVWATCA